MKTDTCRNEHLFWPSAGYANPADEYSNGGFGGTSPQAGLQSLQRWDGGKEGGRSEAPHFGVSGHMLNESSANLEQFMSRQMHVLSSFTPGLSSSTCPRCTHLLPPAGLGCSPSLASFSSLEFPLLFHLLSIFLHRRFTFYQLIVSAVSITSPPPALPVTLHFHISASPPSTFSSGEAVQ